MPMNKNDIKDCLEIQNWNELDEMLKDCKLETKPETIYADAEISRIDNYKELVVKNQLQESYQTLIDEGKTPDEALEQIEEDLKKTEEDSKTDSSEENLEGITLLKMMEKAIERTGQTLSLSRVSEFLKLTGLTEKDSYTSAEVDKFFGTCELVMKEGKSYAYVAEHNGVAEAGNSILQQAQQYTQNRVSNWSGDTAQNIAEQEHQLTQLVNRMHIQQLGNYLLSEDMEEKVKEAQMRLVQQQTSPMAEVLEAYEVWEAQQKEAMRLNGSNPTIKVLPGAEDKKQ